MDPEKKSLNFIFPTKYVIPKNLSRLAIGQVSQHKVLHLHIFFQDRVKEMLSANVQHDASSARNHRAICPVAHPAQRSLYLWDFFGQSREKSAAPINTTPHMIHVWNIHG